MEVVAERLPVYSDSLLKQPIYAHQKFLLHSSDFKQLKVHISTCGGKTLSAILFALSDSYKDPSVQIRTIFTYPTNLLSKDQFENSLIKGLTHWVCATLIHKGVINPVRQCFESNDSAFAEQVTVGAPTYVFQLPEHLDNKTLYLTVVTGEVLQYLFNLENIIELGKRKGTYLFNILRCLNQNNHILVTSPDLLGYVAPHCYSVSGSFYNPRWQDELEVMLSEHKIVIDEYHYYDPYTYINFNNTLNKLSPEQVLLLSATKVSNYFSDAVEFNDKLEAFAHT